jgi:hypothetical protein
MRHSKENEAFAYDFGLLSLDVLMAAALDEGYQLIEVTSRPSTNPFKPSLSAPRTTSVQFRTLMRSPMECLVWVYAQLLHDLVDDEALPRRTEFGMSLNNLLVS